MSFPSELYDRIEPILAGPAAPRGPGRRIGASREGRDLTAYRFGTGERRISLLGGCHADEPVGPRLLGHLVSHLESQPPDDRLLTDYEWWIIPHINPDGAAANRAWQPEDAAVYDLADYLRHVVREKPGDDIEFGFPREPGDEDARPENRAAYDWWRQAAGPFVLHVSLHGMAFAAGPWFLVEAAWRDRFGLLRERCVEQVRELGYRLHDVDRQGEKGFFRLAPGFSTRPDSRYMRRHFRSRGDEETAGLFRPSSMETIRSLGGDPLTLVSEMPLFLTPGVGVDLGPPDPAAEEWRARIDGWRSELREGADPESVRAAAETAGLRPMPVVDQMALQWTFIVAGLEQVENDHSVPR